MLGYAIQPVTLLFPWYQLAMCLRRNRDLESQRPYCSIMELKWWLLWCLGVNSSPLFEGYICGCCKHEWYLIRATVLRSGPRGKVLFSLGNLRFEKVPDTEVPAVNLDLIWAGGKVGWTYFTTSVSVYLREVVLWPLTTVDQCKLEICQVKNNPKLQQYTFS